MGEVAGGFLRGSGALFSSICCTRFLSRFPPQIFPFFLENIWEDRCTNYSFVLLRMNSFFFNFP